MSETPLNKRMFKPNAMAIRYHNPNHELNGELLEPNDPRIPEEGLPMDHLKTEGQIQGLTLMVRKRILVELKEKPAEAPKKSETRDKKKKS